MGWWKMLWMRHLQQRQSLEPVNRDTYLFRCSRDVWGETSLYRGVCVNRLVGEMSSIQSGQFDLGHLFNKPLVHHNLRF